MSFGQTKMRAVSDKHAPNVKVCDHRGRDWIVVTKDAIHYGTAPDGVPQKATSLSEVSDAFKPWAKKLIRTYENATVPSN